jgi:hypothetical protein
MADGPTTQISDLVIPENFTSYIQTFTEQKSRLVQSGVIARSGLLDGFLAGGGLTVNVPAFHDLDDDDERISTDSVPAGYTGGVADPDPHKIQTLTEVAVRMNRNNSWSSMDLAGQLAGTDPLAAIERRVGEYWVRRQQKAFIALMTGIFADNDAAPAGTEHVQGDLTNDISGAAFADNTTNISANALIDTALTMGDSMDDLTVIMCHSVVFARLQKLNLIDFIPDARGEVDITEYLRRRVIVDDAMTASGGVYETWMFGLGAIQYGSSPPKMATEVQRHPGAGNGGGGDVLYNRVQWCMHPTGHAYMGTAANGGPSNAATANNLAAATSWERRYRERKQIKIARLITREA